VDRTEFVLALAAATAARPRAPIRAEIAITRQTNDLLVPVTVSIVLRNTTHASQPLDFPTADLYRVDVLRDGVVVWTSSPPHTPLAVSRRIQLRPGTTPLVYVDIDSLTADRHAFAPGSYTVRVSMLGTTLNSVFDRTIAFAPPISAKQAAASNGPITTAGTTLVDGGIPRLIDDTGSIRLSRPLGIHPTGEYLVRGTLDRTTANPVLAVYRFAPATVPATPAPLPSPA